MLLACCEHRELFKKMIKEGDSLKELLVKLKVKGKKHEALMIVYEEGADIGEKIFGAGSANTFSELEKFQDYIFQAEDFLNDIDTKENVEVFRTSTFILSFA